MVTLTPRKRGRAFAPPALKRTRPRDFVRLVLVLVGLYLLASTLSSGRSTSSTVAWGAASDELLHTVLPEVEDQPPSQLTIVSSAIRREAETYRRTDAPSHFVQLITSLRELSPPVRPDAWQSLVYNSTAQIRRFSCLIDVATANVTATVSEIEGEMRVPWAWETKLHPDSAGSGSALFLHCPLTPEIISTLGLAPGSKAVDRLALARVRILLDMHGHHEPFELPEVTLKPYFPPPMSDMAICTAPLYGNFVEDEVVDWGAHHRELGISAIHWHARDFHFRDWFDQWRVTDGAHLDTFRVAPPIAPEVFGTNALAVEGLYADQVLYALACQQRTTYLAPTRWIWHIDVDEYVLPDPMPATRQRRSQAVYRFLQGFSSYTPSISLGRTHQATNAHLGLGVYRSPNEPTPPSRLVGLGMIRSPQLELDHPGNYKHAHRVDAVEGTSVHAPTALYPGFVYREPIVPAEVRIVHFGRSDFDEGPYEQFHHTPAMTAFEQAVWERKQKAFARLHASGFSRFLTTLKNHPRLATSRSV